MLLMDHYQSFLSLMKTIAETHLYTLVLLWREFVGADGSDRDEGSYQVLVLKQEGEGVHPTERRAYHHHRAQT